MDKLKIEVDRDTFLTDHWRVTGFSNDEMQELYELKQHSSWDTLRNRFVDILDAHNPNQGTCWACGYGIYSIRFNNHFQNSVFVETGSSCD